MKNSRLVILGMSFLLLASSCALFKAGDIGVFYNKRNREKVKLKSSFFTKLFSSKSVEFGRFASTDIEEGIDNSVITFPDYKKAFHFSLSENSANPIEVQAVYAGRNFLEKDSLPPSFYATAISRIFYAYIKGSHSEDWKLILKNPSYDELKNKTVVGMLRADQNNIKIYAHNRSDQKVGYAQLTFEFRYHTLPVAAVQVGAKKYVWTGPGLDQEIKQGVMGAIAAILLR